jgi:two-component system, LuxR family, response regulator FixJ
MSKTIIIVDEGNQSEWLSALFESAGYRVQTFANSDAFLAAPLPDSPDCLLLDMGAPGASGLDLLRILTRRGDAPSVLVIGGDGDVSLAVEAMKLGAVDFLERPCRPATLLEAIGRACALEEQRRHSAEAERRATARLEALSTRLRQVLRGIAMGKPNKIIAYELGLSIRTVESYRAQLLVKLGVRTTAEAIRIALAAGVEPCSARSWPLTYLSSQPRPSSEMARWLA